MEFKDICNKVVSHHIIKSFSGKREPINPELYQIAIKEIGEGLEAMLKGYVDLAMSYVFQSDNDK